MYCLAYTLNTSALINSKEIIIKILSYSFSQVYSTFQASSPNLPYKSNISFAKLFSS